MKSALQAHSFFWLSNKLRSDTLSSIWRSSLIASRGAPAPVKPNHPKLIQRLLRTWLLLLMRAVAADLPRERSPRFPSVAFHGLLLPQLIKRMKSPAQRFASAATFASCHIGKTRSGKISPRPWLFEVISSDSCSSPSLLPVNWCHHRLPRELFGFTWSPEMFEGICRKSVGTQILS